jgi:nicotinamidase-related amidase
MRHPSLACKDDSFLVVVDMQAAFWDLVWQRERVLDGVRLMLRAAPPLGLPVIATEQNPDKIGNTMPQVAELLGDAPVVAKMVFSCWAEPAFARAVASLGRKTAILCGIETHVCLTQTALDMAHAGYRVHLAADAVTSRGEMSWRIALDNMRAAGVIVSSAEAVLFQLLERAGTDEFRAVMSLVKARVNP